MKNRNSFDGCMDAYQDNPQRSGGNVACVKSIVPAVCSSSQEGVQGRSSCPSKTKLLPMEGTGTTLRDATTKISWKEACASVTSITCRCVTSYRSVRDERHMAAQKSRHQHPAQRKNKATAVPLPRHLFPSPIGLKSHAYEPGSGGGDGSRGSSSRFHASLSASESLYTASLYTTRMSSVDTLFISPPSPSGTSL